MLGIDGSKFLSFLLMIKRNSCTLVEVENTVRHLTYWVRHESDVGNPM